MVTHRIDSDFRTVERDTASPEDICATARAWGSRMSGDTDADCAGIFFSPGEIARAERDADDAIVTSFGDASIHRTCAGDLCLNAPDEAGISPVPRVFVIAIPVLGAFVFFLGIPFLHVLVLCVFACPVPAVVFLRVPGVPGVPDVPLHDVSFVAFRLLERISPTELVRHWPSSLEPVFSVQIFLLLLWPLLLPLL